MIVRADALHLPLPDGVTQTCITSPPYWGLRDYGVEGQIGLEASLNEYVAQLVAVFREVRRTLRPDGTLWLNLGDGYARNPKKGGSGTPNGRNEGRGYAGERRALSAGLKPKDLIGLPWLVAFALRADGWWLRSAVVWEKPNCLPEAVRDRPTNSHEMLFLLSPGPTYYYDAAAIREPEAASTGPRRRRRDLRLKPGRTQAYLGNPPRGLDTGVHTSGRNKRTVWRIPTKPFKGAHFAVMPEALVEPCVKAGSRPGDLVIDPFAGAGTVGVVAARLGRRFVGTELNPEYCRLATERLRRCA